MGSLRHHLVFLYFGWTKTNTLITFRLYFAPCEDFLKSLCITRGGIGGVQAVVPVVVVANSIQTISDTALQHMGNSTARRHLLHWVNIALYYLQVVYLFQLCFLQMSLLSELHLLWLDEMLSVGSCKDLRCYIHHKVSSSFLCFTHRGAVRVHWVKYILQSALCSQCPHHS